MDIKHFNEVFKFSNLLPTFEKHLVECSEVEISQNDLDDTENIYHRGIILRSDQILNKFYENQNCLRTSLE